MEMEVRAGMQEGEGAAQGRGGSARQDVNHHHHQQQQQQQQHENGNERGRQEGEQQGHEAEGAGQQQEEENELNIPQELLVPDSELCVVKYLGMYALKDVTPQNLPSRNMCIGVKIARCSPIRSRNL